MRNADTLTVLWTLLCILSSVACRKVAAARVTDSTPPSEGRRGPLDSPPSESLLLMPSPPDFVTSGVSPSIMSCFSDVRSWLDSRAELHQSHRSWSCTGPGRLCTGRRGPPDSPRSSRIDRGQLSDVRRAPPGIVGPEGYPLGPLGPSLHLLLWLGLWS